MSHLGHSIDASLLDAGTVWAFDVDGCLVDSLTGSSRRPGAIELLHHLRARGCRTVLWSAGGADYAEQRAVRLGLHHLFEAFFGKDERGDDGRYLAGHLTTALTAAPTALVFVDDRPEELPAGATVVGVSPYVAPNPHDSGLRRAGLLD